MHVGIIMLAVFIVVLILGLPVAAAMGFSTMIAFLMIGGNFEVISMRLFNGIDNFVFLAIPFFILAAELMASGGITQRIINFCVALVGRIRGGLAQTNIISSVFFAGITGSATADVAALGPLQMKMMTEAGYPKGFSAAVSASSAVISPIIPPSNAMIIYALAAGNVSILALFLGGIIPGLLICASLLIFCYIVSRIRKYPISETPFSWRLVGKCFVGLLPVIFIPVIVFSGKLGGFFVITEAAAIAVLYALIATKFFLKTLTWKKLYTSLLNAAKMSSVVFFIIAIASSMGWAITISRLPQELAAFFVQHIDNKWVFLIFVNLLLLIVGTVMDQAPCILIMTPILLPLSIAFGVNPIHFGLIVCVNLTISLITPPVGMLLFVTSSIAKIPLTLMYRVIIPFFMVQIIVLFIITFVPQTGLFIPGLFGFR